MSDFDELALDLERLAGAPARAAVAAAPRLLDVVHAQHAAGLAPDGAAWPLDKDGRIPLTGLTSQATARTEGAAIVLELPDLLRPHQVGSERLPQRKTVPGEGEPLPATWRTPIDEALAAELGAPRG